MRKSPALYCKSPHFLALAGITLVLICAMLYSYISSHVMITRYYPLVDATMEIKNEATTAHLWFEEIISGDQYENIDDIYSHIDSAKWFAVAMLEGGENKEGVFTPLKDTKMRSEVSSSIEKLDRFKTTTEKRYKIFDTAGAGSDIDQEYDKLFKEFILQIDLVETMLQQKISEDFAKYKKIQATLIILSFILIIMAVSFLRRYEREQAKNMQLVSKNLDQLKLLMDSIDALVYVSDMKTYEVLFINKYGRELFGDITGKICWQTLQAGQNGPCSFCTNSYLISKNDSPAPPYEWEVQNSVTKKWFHIVDRAIRWEDEQLVRLEIASDISKRKEEEIVKEALIEKLETALEEIQTLQGILPICSFCKKIRNDAGYYEQLEGYFHKHSGVDFSHTICPACTQKEYPDLYDSVYPEEQEMK